MESLESYLTLGYVQNRQGGLLYGPFTPVYGVGALALGMFWPGVKDRPLPVIFAVTALVGTAVEYLWSLAQEQLFGVVFWDYQHLPFQMNGRVNLLFSLYWGMLGCVFLKGFYQPFCHFVQRLPHRGRGLVTWSLVVLLLGDFAISSCALFRQRARYYEAAATSSVELFLDETYSDEALKTWFPSMQLRME